MQCNNQPAFTLNKNLKNALSVQNHYQNKKERERVYRERERERVYREREIESECVR